MLFSVLWHSVWCCKSLPHIPNGKMYIVKLCWFHFFNFKLETHNAFWSWNALFSIQYTVVNLFWNSGIQNMLVIRSCCTYAIGIGLGIQYEMRKYWYALVNGNTDTLFPVHEDISWCKTFIRSRCHLVTYPVRRKRRNVQNQKWTSGI